MSSRNFHWGLAILIAAVTLTAAGQTISPKVTPPWSHGNNDPAVNKGYVFAVAPVDNVPDLHGNPANAKLVLFIGGNQFFVLPQLIAGFEALHPDLKGRIFYETLPPGILSRQMSHGNTLTLGNLTLTAAPDVYEAGARRVDAMAKQGILEKSVHYTSNNLAIMVAAGNPKHIRTLRGLARPDVRLSMPNPAWEGVARPIAATLRKAGGEALYESVYVKKVQDGSTFLTKIHHRQTPMRIMEGKSDAGVTWSSEVRFQESIHNPITGVVIPPGENSTAAYAAGVVKNAPHLAAAREWVAYLTTPEAQKIYRSYGFQPLPSKVR